MEDREQIKLERVQRTGRKEQSHERGERGWETRNRDVRQYAPPPLKKKGELHDGRSISSTEVETHPGRGGLVYGGGDSSTQGETRLRRG